MTDYSAPNGDLEEVAKAFGELSTDEVVAFRTVAPHQTR